MRTRWALLAVIATAALGSIAALPGAANAARPATATAGHPAGSYSAPFVLSTFTNMVGYDVAAAANGTAYIGWISDDGGSKRLVHLCTLPVDSSTCTGGIQTIASGDDIDARDLKVILQPGGKVTLVWQNVTNASTTSARGDAIMAAFAPGGANLSQANLMSDAPSHGDLLDVQVDRQGTVWTLEHPGPSSTGNLSTLLELRTNYVDPPQTLHTGFQLGTAQLAIAGSQPFVSFQEAGKVNHPDHWGTPTNGTWAFHAIPHTWTVDGNAALVETVHGPRIVTSIDNASYRPVLSQWTGSTFGPLHFTAERPKCGIQTHDAYADASGRFLDASYDCGNVTLSHFVNSADSAALNFTTGGTPTFAPQIASGIQGIATLVWTTQPTTGTAPLRLWVRRVRLPDVTHTVRTRSSGGTLALAAPVSCLPPVDVTVRAVGASAKGWTVKSVSLQLGKTVLKSPATIDGATLKPGTTYNLFASAEFDHGRSGEGVGFSVPFTTCATATG